MTPNSLPPALQRGLNHARLIDHCSQRVLPYLDLDRDTWEAHSAINQRGVRVDVQLARACHDLVAPVERELISRLQRTPDGRRLVDRLSSPEDFSAELGNHSAQPRSMSVAMLRFQLARMDDGVAKLAIATYLFRCQKEHLRFEKILQGVGPDDCLHDLYDYASQHPGRWGSHGINVHNLTKTKMPSAMITQLINTVKAHDIAGILDIVGPSHTHECLAGLVRPMFIPDPGYVLAVSDLAQVELRIILYLCGDQQALAEFGRVDMHARMAEFVFKEVLPKDDPRYEERRSPIGKVTNLGSGFGLSAIGFEKKCVEEWGIDLAAYGLTGEQVIDAYHTAYPLVKRCWWAHQQATVLVLKARKPCQIGPVRWEMGPFGLMAVLPSGRPMIYHEATVVPGKFNPKDEQIEYTKYGPQGSSERVTAWGGTLVQNLCEAVGRDLIAHSMVKSEAEQLPIRLHTHDELVAQVPEATADADLRRLETIMVSSLPWCAGKLPLQADGFITKRYNKKSIR